MCTLRAGLVVHSFNWGGDNQVTPDHGEILLVQITQAGEYPGIPLRSDRSQPDANSSVCQGQHHIFL